MIGISRLAVLQAILCLTSPTVLAQGGESVVARYDHYRWTCDVSGKRATVRVQFRVTILSPAGKDFGDVYLYESKFHKVRNAEYRLLGSTGKPIQKLKLGDLTKACGYGSGSEMYTDICQYYGSLAIPQYPAVIEGEYTREFDNLAFIASPALQYDDASIALLDITLNCDASDPMEWRMVGFDHPPVVTTTGRRMSIAWHFEDIPHAAVIKRLPLDEMGKPRIDLATNAFEMEEYRVEGRTWQNLGIFYNQLTAGRYALDGSEIATTPGTMEDVRRIYLDQIKATRYVAVEVGLSGWQPRAAQSVSSKGYGDCKDLSTLLVARLRAAGIRSYPVLVRTRDRGLVDPDFPEDGFNHVIACAIIGQDTLWMDPTCSECPPGDLPYMDENTLALLVDETGGTLVRLPESAAWENKFTRVAHLTVDDTAVTTIHVTAQVFGNWSHSLRSFLKHASSDQLTDFTHDYLLAGDRRYRVTGQVHTGVDSVELPVTLIGDLTGTRKLDQIKQVVYLNPFVMVGREKYGDLKLEGRTVAVNLGHPWSILDTVFIGGEILKRCDSLILPIDDSCAFDGGKVVVTYTKMTDGVCAVARQEFTRSIVSPEHFGSFQAFLTGHRKLLDRPVKLHLHSVLSQ